MNKIHNVEEVVFESGMLILTVDGKKVSRKLAEVSSRLDQAAESARKNFEISPSGYGIHWPDCDEDLSVDALMGICHTAPMIAAEDPVEYQTNKTKKLNLD